MAPPTTVTLPFEADLVRIVRTTNGRTYSVSGAMTRSRAEGRLSRLRSRVPGSYEIVPLTNHNPY